MHDKMSEENGAKRVKEECICPVLGRWIVSFRFDFHYH
jgi:hypothetical protein